MKKGVQVKQHDITDCGAACLASISAYFGMRFPIARIRQFASTDQQGTNVLGMIQGFQFDGQSVTIPSGKEFDPVSLLSFQP